MSSVKIQAGPIWLDDVSLPSLPALDRNQKTDVCVVGAGIAGLSAAYLLSRSGGKVVGILTRRDLKFVESDSTPVRDVMTKGRLITAPPTTTAWWPGTTRSCKLARGTR